MVAKLAMALKEAVFQHWQPDILTSRGRRPITQGAKNPLIEEDTLQDIAIPDMVEGIFLNQGVLSSFDLPSALLLRPEMIQRSSI